jgi:hypothetical protein
MSLNFLLVIFHHCDKYVRETVSRLTVLADLEEGWMDPLCLGRDEVEQHRGYGEAKLLSS